MSPKFASIDIKRYYILALLIVGSLAVGSHLLQQTAIENQKGLGAIINLSGRQRMLSQRIASLAAQYRLGDNTAQPVLLTAADEFEAAHQQLSSDYLASAGKSTKDQSLHQTYFDGAHSLDSDVHDYVLTARQIAALQPSDPAMAPLLTTLFAQSRMPLLSALDHVVAIHQAEAENRIADLRHLERTVLGIMLLTLALEAMLIFRPMAQRISSHNAEIVHLATIDGLTGTLNRREFYRRCQAECERLGDVDGSLSVLLLDVDHFKRINDEFGHAAGDAALKSLCGAIRNSLRAEDIFGRIGGEEFAILTPGSTLPKAFAFAERLRQDIAATAIPFDSKQLGFTVSIGVAELTTQEADIDAILDVADKRLYEAKSSGRNRVVALSPA